MVRVPKCTECEFMKEFQGSVSHKTDNRVWWGVLRTRKTCFHPDYKESYPIIESKDIKTSPSWCPKRAKN